MPLPRVLITRPLAAAQPLAEILTQRGYGAVIDPLLEILPLAFTLPSGPFSAILITSANALPALAGIDRGILVLTVGETTTTLAARSGFVSRCIGQSMEEILPALATIPGPILYLSGQDISREIQGAVRVPVYAARQRPLEKATIELLSEGQIDWILLFSRRSAQALEEVVKDMANQDGIARTGLVCISARTAEPLCALPWRDLLIASEPTEAAMIAALEGA